MSKKGAVKKGFFLLEALLASMLLSLLVGVLIHHYGQWSFGYRRAIQQGRALSLLMTLIEQGTFTSPEPETYTLTEQSIEYGEPEGSLALVIPRGSIRRAGRAITLSWVDHRNAEQQLSVMVGDERDAV